MAKPRRSVTSNTPSNRGNYRTGTYYRTVSVTIPVPEYLSHIRTVRYQQPFQRQRFSKSIRIPLTRHRDTTFTTRKIHVRVPTKLPYVGNSYVTAERDRLNIHSKRQTERLLHHEHNRRRYQERKENRRKARHGQIESLHSDRFGIVSEAYHRGATSNQLMDAALAARAFQSMF